MCDTCWINGSGDGDGECESRGEVTARMIGGAETPELLAAAAAEDEDTECAIGGTDGIETGAGTTLNFASTDKELAAATGGG